MEVWGGGGLLLCTGGCIGVEGVMGHLESGGGMSLCRVLPKGDGDGGGGNKGGCLGGGWQWGVMCMLRVTRYKPGPSASPF